MSSIHLNSSDTDSIDSSDFFYNVALHLPVVDIFVSFYELFKKASLSQYTGEIGEKYVSLSDRYFVKKSYSEINCTFVWGIGEMALFAIQYYKKEKAQELFKKALLDSENKISLLKIAANEFQSTDAIYLLGTYYRDGIELPFDPELAITHFKEGASKGDQRSIIALGNIFLTGLGAVEPDSQKALNYFKKGNVGDDSSLSSFSKYREAFVHLLLEFGNKRSDVLDFIKKSADRIDMTFSDSSDLVVNLAKAFKRGELQAVFGNEAEKFFRCATQHLPEGALKTEVFYQLALCTNNWTDYQKAADLGHIQAAYELSALKRESALKQESQDVAKQLRFEAFSLLAALPSDEIEKNSQLALQLGHYYLGLGSQKPQLDKALEYYRGALTSINQESEKTQAHVLIDCITLLQDWQLRNRGRYETILQTFGAHPQLWQLLSLEKTIQFPLFLATKLNEAKEFEMAQKLFELCKRQKDRGIQLSSNYALSQIDSKKAQQHLEQCINLDPQHWVARTDLYCLLKETNKDLAESYLKPALNAGIPEALYQKGLTMIAEADKYVQNKAGLGFGNQHVHDNKRKELLLQAKEFIIPAAQKGHVGAQGICKAQQW